MEGSSIEPIIPQNKPEKQAMEIDLGGELGKLEILSKNNFEYSKNVQNETGIVGYERTIISKDTLRKLHEEKGGNSGEVLTKALLDHLSDGEFFTMVRHQMGGNAGDKRREKYEREFADKQFILQKIFDIESIKDFKQEKMGSAYSHGALDNGISFGLFNKQNFKIETNNISPGDIPNYQEKIDSGDFFLCNTNSGLSDVNPVSLMHGEGGGTRGLNLFYDKSTEAGRNHYNITNEFPSGPVFAFDPTESGLHEYFKEVYDLYIQLNKANHTNIVGSDYDMLYGLYEKVNYATFLNMEDDEKNSTRKRFLKEIDQEFKKDSDYNRVQKDPSRLENNEGVIPIVIGNDKIKQLRWGDSKYAVFYTEKGLNFLKIKHVEVDDQSDKKDSNNEEKVSMVRKELGLE